jgi:RNA polymerase-binding transcription factor
MAGQTARKLAETTSATARRGTKAATKRAAGKKTAGKKTAAKPVPAQKAAPQRAPRQAATKVPAAQAAAEPTTTGTAAKKAPATKAASTSRKSPTKRAPAKKAPARKATAQQAANGSAPAKRAPARRAAAEPQVPAQKTAARKAATRRTSARKAVATHVVARRLAVKEGEKAWTTAELDEVRGELVADRSRLLSELNLVEHELQDLMRDAGDGAGNDQADVGSTTFERDHEMSLANNARHMLAQTERALSRIDDGSYGVCESCGEPIGKMRVMAFPRATLCLTCKQREERR